MDPASSTANSGQFTINFLTYSPSLNHFNLSAIYHYYYLSLILTTVIPTFIHIIFRCFDPPPQPARQPFKRSCLHIGLHSLKIQRNLKQVQRSIQSRPSACLLQARPLTSPQTMVPTRSLSPLKDLRLQVVESSPSTIDPNHEQ